MKYLELIKIIIELIRKYGAPALDKLKEAWGVTDEELIAKIDALKGTFPDPEDFFGVGKVKED